MAAEESYNTDRLAHILSGTGSDLPSVIIDPLLSKQRLELDQAISRIEESQSLSKNEQIAVVEKHDSKLSAKIGDTYVTMHGPYDDSITPNSAYVVEISGTSCTAKKPAHMWDFLQANRTGASFLQEKFVQGAKGLIAESTPGRKRKVTVINNKSPLYSQVVAGDEWVGIIEEKDTIIIFTPFAKAIEEKQNQLTVFKRNGCTEISVHPVLWNGLTSVNGDTFTPVDLNFANTDTSLLESGRADIRTFIELEGAYDRAVTEHTQKYEEKRKQVDNEMWELFIQKKVSIAFDSRSHIFGFRTFDITIGDQTYSKINEQLMEALQKKGNAWWDGTEVSNSLLEIFEAYTLCTDDSIFSEQLLKAYSIDMPSILTSMNDSWPDTHKYADLTTNTYPDSSPAIQRFRVSEALQQKECGTENLRVHITWEPILTRYQESSDEGKERRESSRRPERGSVTWTSYTVGHVPVEHKIMTDILYLPESVSDRIKDTIQKSFDTLLHDSYPDTAYKPDLKIIAKYITEYKEYYNKILKMDAAARRELYDKQIDPKNTDEYVLKEVLLERLMNVDRDISELQKQLPPDRYSTFDIDGNEYWFGIKLGQMGSNFQIAQWLDTHAEVLRERIEKAARIGHPPLIDEVKRTHLIAESTIFSYSIDDEFSELPYWDTPGSYFSTMDLTTPVIVENESETEAMSRLLRFPYDHEVSVAHLPSITLELTDGDIHTGAMEFPVLGGQGVDENLNQTKKAYTLQWRPGYNRASATLEDDHLIKNIPQEIENKGVWDKNHWGLTLYELVLEGSGIEAPQVVGRIELRPDYRKNGYFAEVADMPEYKIREYVDTHNLDARRLTVSWRQVK